MKQRFNPFYYANNPELLRYERAWSDYIKNKRVPLSGEIQTEVFESWEDSVRAGINPFSRETKPPLDNRELEIRRIANKRVLFVAEKYMKAIYETIGDTDITLDFVDKDGYIIRNMCSPGLTEISIMTSTGLGYNESEKVSGTTAIALALKHKKAMQISGAQFFLQKFHTWTSAAAPVLDTDESVLGVIAVSGYYETVHKHTLGIVIAAKSAIENELHIQSINDQLESTIRQRHELLGMVTDGVVYAENGVIKQVNQEICRIIGEKESDMINRRIEDVIKTRPRIEKILYSEGVGYENREIVLEGRKNISRCIYDIRVMREGDDLIQLFLVTRIDEIKTLAEKITNEAEATFDDIVCKSSLMREKINVAKRAAHFNSRVLIQGESGTGKEIIAQAIHNESSRKYNPFVAIDCGAIPRELFESEMFGYVKGAFTDAKSEGKIGLLELADNGTVFLDEVGNMPIEMQAKLLRVLQEGTIVKVGSVEKIDVDIRVIAATNVDLKKAVMEGTFREDLYYRLNVINIEVPPLRERKEDIPSLVSLFIKQSLLAGKQNGKITVAPKAMHMLAEYEWPGNVRQLQNVVERLLIFAENGVITERELPMELRHPETTYDYEPKGITLEEMTVSYIKRVLAENNGNITKASEVLGISRATIYNKLKMDRMD